MKDKLYKKIDNNKIQCLACNHYCKIPQDQTGICVVRKNIENKLELLVYEKPVSIHIDPIEKKPIYHFLPGTEILSIGTVGCNFKCDFCQNWQTSQLVKDSDNIERFIDKYSQNRTPEQIVEQCVNENIPSIAYTYNEPAIFIEYAYDIAKLANKHKIKNVFVSNGYESKESIEKISPYLDAINVDLKSFSDDFYRKICGGKLQPVLDNIKRYLDYDIWVEITTLVIPGQNDSDEELTKIADFIAKQPKTIPWHISRFSPGYKMNDISPTPFKVLENTYRIGKDAGLKYVYVGNIPSEKFQNTYCPECDEILIKRDWMTGINIALGKNGVCKNCGHKIDIVLN